MKMALLTGRDFSDADREGTPSVVIVNETAARARQPAPPLCTSDCLVTKRGK